MVMNAATKISGRRLPRFGRGASLALLSAAVIALSACGSSSKPAASVSNPTTSTSQSASNANAIVLTSGAKLTDPNGMTLYTLTNAGKPVACTGQCATFWPPLLLPSGSSTPVGASGVTGLGVVSMNGGMQVTVNGDPLYRYSGDKSPGDTNGEGITSFGGTWHAGQTTATTGGGTPTTTSPPASSGGGGSGY
jgi:predicted lipoprotein with Yx(FWY)xxD motif